MTKDQYVKAYSDGSLSHLIALAKGQRDLIKRYPDSGISKLCQKRLDAVNELIQLNESNT